LLIENTIEVFHLYLISTIKYNNLYIKNVLLHKINKI